MISADELHAYVDGALAPARHFAVALYLAEHPREAAAAEAFRAQIAGMKALFDPVLDEPIPRRLRRLRPWRSTRRTARSLWAITASIVVTLVVVGGALVADSRFAVVSGTAIHIPAAVRSQVPVQRRLPVLPPPASGPKRPRAAEI